MEEEKGYNNNYNKTVLSITGFSGNLG